MKFAWIASLLAMTATRIVFARNEAIRNECCDFYTVFLFQNNFFTLYAEFLKRKDMKSIEDSVIALPERRSIDDIKKSYPDEWILVGDPEENEQEMGFRTGIVLYHSPDKRELAYRPKPLLKQVKTTYHFFNRVTPRPQRSAIVSIYSTPLK